MVRYSNGGLKTRLKKACLWSKMSGIRMVHQVTWLNHLNTKHPYCPVFRWIWYSGVQYSDGYCMAKIKKIDALLISGEWRSRTKQWPTGLRSNHPLPEPQKLGRLRWLVWIEEVCNQPRLNEQINLESAKLIFFSKWKKTSATQP